MPIDLTDELLARSGELAQGVDMGGGNKTASDQTVRMQVNHPVGVLAVALAARQILDLGWIRKGQLELTLQGPPHALPVASRGFHHHVPHLVASQPGRQLRELARGRTVGATLASNAAGILNPNGRCENVLPKVQSCAARIDHMHTNTLRALARDPICRLPKTGKRARSSRCRLLRKMRIPSARVCSQALRFAAAPLIGAPRIPGHTWSRVHRHHCYSDL